MTADPDAPLLHATYHDDAAVMRDGKVMIRAAIFLSTAVTGDPHSVHVVYLPATALLAQAAEVLGPIEGEAEDDDPLPFRPLRDW